MVTLYEQPLALILGFGVYSYTGALDGGILKFLFEFGLFAFVYTYFMLYTKNHYPFLW